MSTIKSKFILSVATIAAISLNLTTANPCVELGFDVIPSFQKQDSVKNLNLDQIHLFKQYSTNLAPYLGFKFNEELGLETGLEYQGIDTHKTIIMRRRDELVGLNEHAVFKTSIQTNTPYFGLTAEYPCVTPEVKVFGMIGAAYGMQKLTFKLVELTGVELSEQMRAPQEFKDNKLMPIAKLGVKYNFSNHFGMRASLNWKMSSRLNHGIAQGQYATGVKYASKDQYGVAVGLYCNIG